ncbi:phenylalanine--tRNA ligase subunit beta [Candidatus Curtissbacteria bacterium RIFCSPHIGHO2_02_FULL_42_15]|uniref:Phenylalanine--tRNA ligase beta subunit n=1 Tax=Candidatus Curtissbacteria bacterium RIFCSPHIGHO2_02_FULL_42_15 TaxID=1797716 RepID=A0A1F5GH72_9BACT|nr:MAG: phenylalanine--tRNA ligase subunit beta [Candidatus Curtissbacteria bacterium RIFCSPHIGHO2_02_FULL_42_15]
MNIKIPVSWLRDYLKTDVAAKTLANTLSASGPSVERIDKVKEDYVFDIEVTSNRTDSVSVFGLAREANAILSNLGEKSNLILPKGINLVLEPDTVNILNLDVTIKDLKLCPRFTAIVLDNVKIRPSPAVIQNRLTLSGIRPINNIVDITNYIMLETGQPMHAFDFDKIKGPKMVLRESTEGEKIVTLDKTVRKLPKGSIVIEDAERLIDLCGIMGGANSQISKRTKRVVLFVQAYDPKTIRKTTQSMAFRTEAASRFEKGVDLEGILNALSRAVYLAKTNANAKIASELVDIYKVKSKTPTITLAIKKLNNYLGEAIHPNLAVKILSLLGFEAKLQNETVAATPPSWRIDDVADDVDLIEEIARIYGYQNLKSEIPKGDIPISEKDTLEEVIGLKKALKFLGLTEVISYSIISQKMLALAETKRTNVVELQNPLTENWQYMRPSLLPSLAEIIGQNQFIRQNLRIFEIAKTYIAQGDELPKQDLQLALVLSHGDFFEVKGYLENIAEIIGREMKLKPNAKKHPLFIENQSAAVFSGKERVGTVGVLDSKITNYFNIKGAVAALEINLSTIYSLPTTAKTYKPIPKYPPVIEDISAIFAKQAPLDEIIQTAKKAGAPLVKTVEVIDVFEDEKLGVDKKSVTLRLTYQKSDDTPAQEEVTETRNKISSALEKSLLAQIRK